MATDRTRERLATLLRQAEEFRRHGEDGSADAALARAEEMMIKYSLGYPDLEDLVTESPELRDEVLKIIFTFTGIYRQAELSVVNRIVKSFGTARTIIAAGYTERNVDELWIITHDSERERFSALIASIQVQLHSALAVWWQRNRATYADATAMVKFKAKRQFILSFGRGAAERIERARAALMKQYPDTHALVTKSRSEVDLFMAQFDTRNVRSRVSSGDRRAHDAGYAAGLSTNTGDTGVGAGGRRQITG